jgi:mutator protein MutT
MGQSQPQKVANNRHKSLTDKYLKKSSAASPPPVPVEVAIVALCVDSPPTPPHPKGQSGFTPHILITKRLTNTFYPGYWELPGGKLEPNETPAQAARREAREELGIEIETLSVLPPIEHTYEHARVRLHTCVARMLADSPPPRNIQVADHRWCSLDQLPWESFLPANVRVISALRRHLAGDDNGAEESVTSPKAAQ